MLTLLQTYILSLPSFQWINVTDSSNPDLKLDDSDPVGRRGHNCQMFNNRQFISLGGDIVFGTDPVNALKCNESWPSVKVFDASALTWQDQFQPDLGDYYIPDKVTNVIGGRYANLTSHRTLKLTVTAKLVGQLPLSLMAVGHRVWRASSKRQSLR